jgi:hypothetical protein
MRNFGGARGMRASNPVEEGRDSNSRASRGRDKLGWSDLHSLARLENILSRATLIPGPMVHSTRLGWLSPSLHNEWNGLCSPESTDFIGITSFLSSIRKSSRGMSSRFLTSTVIHPLKPLLVMIPTFPQSEISLPISRSTLAPPLGLKPNGC